MMPQFQTRLIHLYYRLIRLKERRDTEGLEGVCSTLLSDYFGLPAKEPETPEGSSHTNGSQEDENSTNEEEEASSEQEDDIDDEIDDEESDEEVGEDKQNKRKKGKKVSRSSGSLKSDQQLSQSEDLVKILVAKMDEIISEKLNALCLDRETKSLDKLKPKKKKSNVDKEHQKRGKRQKAVQEKKTLLRKKDHPVLEQNLDKLFQEEFEEDRSEQAASKYSTNDGESEDEEQMEEKYLRRRPRPVSDWKLRYDGKDDGRNLNKFLTEVEFLAKAEGISKQTLFNEAIHLFIGDARAWFIEGTKKRFFVDFRLTSGIGMIWWQN